MNISEIFYSIQWEWPNAGKPSIFVRFFWCNLSCERCDSKYAWKELDGLKRYDIDKVIDKIRTKKGTHIVFTGWEPTLYEKDIKKIQEQLPNFYTYEIETNWSKKIKNKYDTVNVSYKLDQDYELKAINKNYNYKFVINKEEDFKKMQNIIDKFNILDEKVYLMPAWTTLESQIRQDILDFCLEMEYNYCMRQHIILFWDKRWV